MTKGTKKIHIKSDKRAGRPNRLAMPYPYLREAVIGTPARVEANVINNGYTAVLPPWLVGDGPHYTQIIFTLSRDEDSEMSEPIPYDHLQEAVFHVNKDEIETPFEPGTTAHLVILLRLHDDYFVVGTRTIYEIF